MKKNALWYNIIYYNVIPIILSGICIFFFREYIYTTLWTFTSIDLPVACLYRFERKEVNTM